MRVERARLEELSPQAPCVLTLGSFDGLHLAHQALIQRVVEGARRMGLAACLLSFEPHPRELLHDGRPPVARLTLSDEKLDLLGRFNLDSVVLLTFTTDLARWEAERFLREALLQRLGMRHLVVGDNHAFGRNRGGDTGTLQQAARELSFGLEIMEPLVVDGDRVSSTRLRHLLTQGLVQEASHLLGRAFAFHGQVRAGRGRGHHLGFPTANLQVEKAQLLPMDGVYAVAAQLPDGRRVGGMMNLGPRPTFGEEEHVPEIHLLGFQEDLYGQRLRVELLARVRDTLRFESGEQLMTQLQEDRRRIQDWLKIHPF